MKNVTKSPITSIKVYDVKMTKHNLVEVSGRPFWALTFRKSGVTKINIGNKSLISYKNCVTLTPKNQPYTTEIVEDTEIIAVHFECLDDNALQTPFVFETNDHILPKLFDALLKSYSAKDEYNFECYSLFYELLDTVDKHIKKAEKSKFNSKIVSAKKEIDKHFSEVDFNINKLSDVLGINASYLRREFKKAYHISPISYLKEVRMQNAISLLLSDYYSVDEIARKCGYGSTSYFIQVFHKKKGYSPQKYKERYMK